LASRTVVGAAHTRLIAWVGDRRGQARTWYTEGLIHGRADRTQLAIEALETSWGLYEPEDPERPDVQRSLDFFRAS
jgi:hypothetical protein